MKTIDFKNKFLEIINDDLNMPKALAIMWQVIKSKDLSNKQKYNLLLDFDKVFGLNIKLIKTFKIPEKAKKLAKQREVYRKKGDWKKADIIRQELKRLGYKLEDTKKGPKITKL